MWKTLQRRAPSRWPGPWWIARWLLAGGVLAALGGCPFFELDGDDDCVYGGLPGFTLHPESTTVTDGATVVFNVRADQASYYRWQEGSTVLRRSDSQLDNASDSLTVGPVSMSDDGRTFVVFALSCRGESSSFTARLTVLPLAPVIDQGPRDLSVPEGRSATFEVVATGTAPLSYQWRRDGADIAGATGASYTIDSVTLGDSGARFDVIVSNAAGPVQSGVATLTVEESASPASLDRSFGAAGVAVTTLAGHDLFPHTLVNLPDGRHAIVGRAQVFGATMATKLVVAVYRPDGTPDGSVGAGGLIVQDVAAWLADRAPAETFQGITLAEAPARSAAYHERNGVAGLVVGLQATTTADSLPAPYTVLARFWLAGPAAGGLDPGFGNAGVVRQPSPTSPGARITRGLAVDSQQRLYELVTTTFTTSALQGSGSSLRRWRADGTADADWGPGGEVVLNDPLNAPGQRVEVLPDGRVLVAAIERDDPRRHLVLARFDADGSLDGAYGNGGHARLGRGVDFNTLNATGAALWQLAMAGSGRVLVGVSGADYPYVARLSADGAVDVTWTAMVLPEHPGYWRETAACGLHTLADGRVMTLQREASGFAVRRWLADLSSLDPSFHRDDSGLASTATVYPFENLSYASFSCVATHLQADGRIVVAGRAFGAVSGLPNGFGLVRLRGGDQ